MSSSDTNVRLRNSPDLRKNKVDEISSHGNKASLYGRSGSTNDTIWGWLPLKYLSLILLIVQSTILVLALRYSRTNPGPDGLVYLSSTAIVAAEMLKLFSCLCLILKEKSFNFGEWKRHLREELWHVDTIKLSVPGILYLIQNNLLFVALSNLEAAVYQVTYQAKILMTGLFSVLLLGKSLSRAQTFSLFILALGVAVVQISNANTASPSSFKVTGQRPLIGLVCVLLACCSSGFAGVYFEKILKRGRKVSLWMRNVQLSIFGIAFGLFAVYTKDGRHVASDGFFQGYGPIVWFVVLLQAVGGLMIAVVVKYADNILKGFATSISILISSIISAYFFDFHITFFFFVGSSMVMTAIYMYGKKSAPETSSILPTSVQTEKE